MKLTLMKSKIHRATVTQADLNYEGSISIGPELIEAAQFVPYEKVDIYNVNNGERFSTYVIEGTIPGEIGLNGAAARLVQPGDKIIIVTYGQVKDKEAHLHKPTVVFVDDNNRIKTLKEKSGHHIHEV